jgi:hypothetical protein
MINEWWVGRNSEGGGCVLIKALSWHSLGWITENNENPCQDSRCSGRESKRVPRSLEYFTTLLGRLQLTWAGIVGIATGYWLEDRGVGVRIPVGLRIFPSPCRDRLWGPPSLPSNGYRGLFLRGLSGEGVKLTTHLQLVPRSRKRGSIHPLPNTPSWRSV